MFGKELDAVKHGDKKAFDGLSENFMPLINKEVRSAISRCDELNGHFDEMKQEALLALYNATLNYNKNERVTFGLFAKICIRRRIISYVRKEKTRLKKLRKNESVSQDIKKSDSPDELLEIFEKNNELKKFLENNASKYEKKVLDLYLQKKSYAEIAGLLCKDQKSVDNALFRVKSKIKKRFY